MSIGSGAGQRAERLLEVALGLGGCRRVSELLEKLRAAFAQAGTPAVAGIAVRDEERGLFHHHALLGERREDLLAPLAESGLPGFAAQTRAGALLELDPRRVPASDPLLAMCLARGAAQLACAPLYFGERALGMLFAASAGSCVPELLPELELLARIVEPHLWNCFTDERFARGDRRRDALLELSRVINSSLDPLVVLELARAAIGGFEGHRTSWLGLLEEGGASWKRHERGPSGEQLDRESEPVQQSVLQRILAEGRTYESGDLARERPFRGDEQLAAAGVRRYVATPLRAGGKLLGVFLFGSADPYPPLRIDVWMLENVALQVALALDNARHHQELRRLSARREEHNLYLREELSREQGAGGMIGRSRAMQVVFERIARVAGTASTVLVSGPTGTGKELVARAIHDASRVREQPMVKLNCAAIPEGMVESELFGHERGAFTSAVERRIGRFELAQNGTLFLDEVGELPLGVQAKLLRVLQSGEFERVGGARTLRTDARIVAATNRDLARAVEAGSFRSDLYYRLNVFPIEVPPLDERREDVPLLVDAFLQQISRRMGKRFEGVEAQSMAHLCERSWPGNVRELQHEIERAVILCDGPLLRIELPATGPAAVARLPQRSATLRELEAAHLRAALERSGWVVEGSRGAARELGLKPSTLRFRMKRLGIQRPEDAP